MEKRVTLTFDDPSSITILNGRAARKYSVVILYGTVSASILFLVIMTVRYSSCTTH